MTNKLKKNLYILSSLLIVILVLYLFKLLKMFHLLCLIFDIALPVVFGYILAWILFPLFKILNNKLNSKLSLSIIIASFIVIYGLILMYVFPMITGNIRSLTNIFTDLIDKVSKYPYLKDLENLKNIDVNVLIDSCTNIASYISIFAFSHVFGFYILFTYENINDFFKNLIPKKYKNFYSDYTKEVSINMRQYLKGTLIDTLILFVASSIIYFLLGLKYPILLALFSAVTNIIPFVGPYIGGIPAVLMGLTSSLNLGLITLAAIVIVQIFESNLVNPMIMSKCIKINPIVIIIALSIMGKLFGLIGMIFAVPALILIKITIPFIEMKKLKFKKVANST